MARWLIPGKERWSRDLRARVPAEAARAWCLGVSWSGGAAADIQTARWTGGCRSQCGRAGRRGRRARREPRSWCLGRGDRSWSGLAHEELLRAGRPLAAGHAGVSACAALGVEVPLPNSSRRRRSRAGAVGRGGGAGLPPPIVPIAATRTAAVVRAAAAVVPGPAGARSAAYNIPAAVRLRGGSTRRRCAARWIGIVAPPRGAAHGLRGGRTASRCR